MESYLIVILVGAIVSAFAYGLYDLSNVHFTGEFAIPSTTVTSTAVTSVFTATPVTENVAETTTSTQTSASTPIPKASFNEIMYDPVGSDEGREWVEIYGDGLNISGWKFFEANTNHRMVLKKGSDQLSGYAIISNNATRFLESYPSFSSTLFEASFSLSNTGEHLELHDTSGNTISSLDYSNSLGANGNGKSLEYRLNGWGESSVTGGTPGSKNSEPSQTSTTPATQSTTTASTTQTIQPTSSITSTSSTSQTSSTTLSATSSTTSTSTTEAQSLTLSISVAKDPIVRGNSQTLTLITAVDSASVNCTVTYASGTTTKDCSGITNATGEYSYTWTIGSNSKSGTFSVTATASRSGYTSGSASTTFQVINATQ